MNILFIGDIVGKVGREVVSKMIDRLTNKYDIDFIIANGENITHGKGISEDHLNDLLDMGVDVVTLGNHYAAKKDVFNFLDSYECLIRPLNVHKSIPGIGTNVFNCNGIKIRVTNLLGTVYMNMNLSNPFDALEDVVNNDTADIHIVDFHAEATGEKYAIAHAFDGKVSAVLGTHTHIQTRDTQILPKGTAFISDVGMCGPYESILGVKIEDVVKRTWTGINTVFNVKEEGKGLFGGVILTFDDLTNKCIKIEPIYKVLNENEF